MLPVAFAIVTKSGTLPVPEAARPMDVFPLIHSKDAPAGLALKLFGKTESFGQTKISDTACGIGLGFIASEKVSA